MPQPFNSENSSLKCLTVAADQVKIEAPQKAGVFYGIQTLLQLLPTSIYNPSPVEGVKWIIPCVEIEDKPRFQWRGMHLDVCRYFIPKEFIKNANSGKSGIKSKNTQS